MSNPLSIRRVMFQNLNEDGTPDGKPTYGVIGSDNENSEFNNSFDTIEELNAAISSTGCIADLLDGFQYEVDRKVIGEDNYYGKNWFQS